MPYRKLSPAKASERAHKSAMLPTVLPLSSLLQTQPLIRVRLRIRAKGQASTIVNLLGPFKADQTSELSRALSLWDKMYWWTVGTTANLTPD
jgi:hypothetical protein